MRERLQTSDHGLGGLRRIGFLIPEFPTQTHIAWWRVSRAMRSHVEVQLLSTRRPSDGCPHPMLQQDARDTLYLWPLSASDALAGIPLAARNLARVAAYTRRLEAFPGRRKARLLALLAAAVRLHRVSRRCELDHIFVHSCGDAAYVVALCRLMGGPHYSLRLGGDLEVYGTDHPSKMRQSTLVVPAAASYEPRLIHEVGLEPDQVMWSWVGTDTDLFRPAELPRHSGVLRVVTVARLNQAKGYQHALPAIARLRQEGLAIEYRIIGEGPFRQEIERLIREIDLAEHVSLLGAQPAEQIAKIHAESDIFLLPTSGIGEGTPAAICEAMSAGLPVVATSVGGLADMIDDGVHGRLVRAGDPEALADGIRSLALDEQFRRRAGVESRTRAEREFSVDAVAVRILEKITSRLRGEAGSPR